MGLQSVRSCSFLKLSCITRIPVTAGASCEDALAFLRGGFAVEAEDADFLLIPSWFSATEAIRAGLAVSGIHEGDAFELAVFVFGFRNRFGHERPLPRRVWRKPCKAKAIIRPVSSRSKYACPLNP